VDWTYAEVELTNSIAFSVIFQGTIGSSGGISIDDITMIAGR